MKKAYISIPVTLENYADQKNHAFNVTVNLGIKGYEAVSTFDAIPSVSAQYNKILAACVEQLLECDAIYLCKGWQNSKACQSELQVALIHGKEVITE